MDYSTKSKAITLLLLNSAEYQSSQRIHIYNSLKSEPDTQYIINHAKKSSRDIYYPHKDPYSNEENIDLAIIPGTLFDKYMHRKGRGGGYYDKFLSTNNTIIKVGLTFQQNVISYIKPNTWDIDMDMVITENGIITPNNPIKLDYINSWR